MQRRSCHLLAARPIESVGSWSKSASPEKWAPSRGRQKDFEAVAINAGPKVRIRLPPAEKPRGTCRMPRPGGTRCRSEGTTFPVILNTFAGVRGIDANLFRASRSLGASDFEISGFGYMVLENQQTSRTERVFAGIPACSDEPPTQVG
jgi:hypothetical protein